MREGDLPFDNDVAKRVHTRRTFIFFFFNVFVHATAFLWIHTMHEADKNEVCHEQLPS